jgi:O-antigen/teichoic acid export membrane protein
VENFKAITAKVKETFVHGVVYGLGEVATKLVGFILIPLYTSHLSTSDYGILALLTICGSIGLSIFGLGLNSALFRSYYDYKEEKERRVVVSTAFIISFISASALWMIGLLSAPLFSDLIFGKEEYVGYLKILFLASGLDILSGMPLAVFRARKESKKYSILTVLFIAMRLVLIIYFVAFLKKGIWGIIVANCIASFLKAAILYLSIIKNITLSFSRTEAYKMLFFGIPLIATNLGALVINMSNRFFLKYYGSLSDVGLYSLGYQFGMIIQIILVIPFSLIWSPMVFSLKDESFAREYYSKMFTYFVMIGLFFCLALALMSKEVIQLMAEKTFWDGYYVVPIIALSYLFLGMRISVNIGIALARKSYYYAIVTVSGALINVLLNFAFIPHYGMMGAAWATLISFVIMWIMQYIISQRLYVISYEWIRIVKLFATSVIMYIIISYVSTDNIVISLLIKGALCLTYPLALLLVGFFDEEELHKISQYMERIRFPGRVS